MLAFGATCFWIFFYDISLLFGVCFGFSNLEVSSGVLDLLLGVSFFMDVSFMFMYLVVCIWVGLSLK